MLYLSLPDCFLLCPSKSGMPFVLFPISLHLWLIFLWRRQNKTWPPFYKSCRSLPFGSWVYSLPQSLWIFLYDQLSHISPGIAFMYFSPPCSPPTNFTLLLLLWASLWLKIHIYTYISMVVISLSSSFSFCLSSVSNSFMSSVMGLALLLNLFDCLFNFSASCCLHQSQPPCVDELSWHFKHLPYCATHPRMNTKNIIFMRLIAEFHEIFLKIDLCFKKHTSMLIT